MPVAEHITIEFTNRVDRKKDDYSWVQGLEKRPTYRRLFGAVKHGVKTWVEQATNVHIVRRAKFARSEFVAEYHHHSYDNPWCHGRDVGDYLISRGLQPSHNLLDFGCGSIRAGIWLIGYLDSGHYFGMDAHLPSLEAAVQYEIPLHRLEHKQPRFLHSRTFEIDYFRQTFDVILASSVLNHLSETQVDLALRNITSALAPSGKLVVAPRLPLDEATLKTKYRLDLIHAEKRPNRFVDMETPWFELMSSKV
jgi:2-polyprenyl-3-methyl-5-hydroxy-6-metoxy-1,4-benzoquinol methylase